MDLKRNMFFSNRNKDNIKKYIITQCEQSIGQPLNNGHLERLDKSLNHYMNEVWSTHSQTQMLPVLNREVNMITSREFISYLNKPPAKKVTPARTQPSYTRMSTSINDLQLGPQIYQDTGRSLDDLRKERQGVQGERPAIPDFRISSDEDGPSPMDLYQMAKAAREREAAALINKADANEENDKNVFKTILGNEIVPSRDILPPPIKTKKSTNEPPLMPPPRVMDPFAIDQPVQPSGKQLTLLRQDDVIQ